MARFIAIWFLTVIVTLPLLIVGSIWASKAYLRHKQAEGTLNITPSSLPLLREGTTTVSAPSVQPEPTTKLEVPKPEPKLYPAKPRFIRKAPKRKHGPCFYGYDGKCYPIDAYANWRATPVMRPDGTYPEPGEY